jgi:hypothetical protein
LEWDEKRNLIYGFSKLMDGSELDESFNPNKIGKKMIQFFIL